MFQIIFCDNCGSGGKGNPFTEVTITRQLKRCDHCFSPTEKAEAAYFVCDLICLKKLLDAGFPCKRCCSTGSSYGSECHHCVGKGFHGTPGVVDDIHFVQAYNRQMRMLRAAMGKKC